MYSITNGVQQKKSEREKRKLEVSGEIESSKRSWCKSRVNRIKVHYMYVWNSQRTKTNSILNF